MKKRFKTLIMFAVMIGLVTTVTAQKSTKKWNQSWPASEVETLEITNKFGEVKVLNTTGSQVTIEVVVTAEGSENKAKALLDDISVKFGKAGSTARAETSIAQNFRSKNNFSIDYTVQIPAGKNLNINNKFGNVVVQSLTGRGVFDISYGNLTGGQIHSPGNDGVQLTLAYGRADVESMHHSRLVLSYSKIFVKSAGNIRLESKYSTLNVDKMESLWLDSKYDTFEFGTLVSLEGESKFTNYRIGTLEKKLKLISGYGAVRVDHIPADFELIDVNSSYAQISLGVAPGATYDVNAVCEFCSIDYPASDFRGNRQQENTRQSIEGKVSGGGRGKVTVVSRYGNIKLVK